MVRMLDRTFRMFTFQRLLVAIAIVTTLVLTLAAGSHAASRSEERPRVGISSSDSSVTVYGANWCSACKSLEKKLDERRIPFSIVDVDRNPEAHDRAKKASGMGSGIPLTHITQNASTWVQGDDADAVERAYKGQ